MRIQSSSFFHLSPFPPSRHVSLRRRPVFTPNFQRRHYFPTCLSHNRIENSPISPNEPIPPPSKSKPKPLIEVTNKRCENWGHIRILTLNSPENRNAISWQLLNELRHEIELVRAQRNHERFLEVTPSGLEEEIGEIQHGPDGSGKRIKKPIEIKERNRAENPYPKRPLGPTRVIIIASELNVFCAGADLKQRAEMSIEETAEFITALRSTFDIIANLSVPSISAVAGDAHGGGLELALATHFRVFSSAAWVSLPETRLGIIPGAGGTHRLRAIAGKPYALDLILTGRKVAATDAYSRGLCQRMVAATRGEKSRAAVLEESLRVADKICWNPPLTINAVVTMLKGGMPTPTVDDIWNSLSGTVRMKGKQLYQPLKGPMTDSQEGGLRVEKGGWEDEDEDKEENEEKDDEDDEDDDEDDEDDDEDDEDDDEDDEDEEDEEEEEGIRRRRRRL